MRKQDSASSWLGATIVVIVVVVAGGYMAYRAMHPAPTQQPVVPPASAASAGGTAAGEPVQHPMSRVAVAASASSAPLPALDESDASVLAGLRALPGGSELDALLRHGQVIQRIVATVDALPRHALGRSVLPVHGPKGRFAVQQTQGVTLMDGANAQRYAAYMQALQAMDTDAVVQWYVHAYPLFQQAYRQLGYPTGYFNDRLVEVIDNLLATPELAQPAALHEVSGHYEYVDPSLESLSVGQKMLLRAGPADEAAVKARLRELRNRLTGASLPVAK